MHPIDRILIKRRVMHRAEVAKLSSRATLKRRIDAGHWWRPTYRTVAPVGVERDGQFELLTAIAHAWPDGALTGPAMLYALGRLLERPVVLDLSVGRDRRATHSGNVRIHPLSDRRVEVAYVDGVEVPIDLGPASVLTTALGAAPETAAWLLIDALGSANTRSRTHLRTSSRPILARLRRTGRRGIAAIRSMAEAVANGCQSPSEVEAWRLLVSTGLEFTAQKAWSIPPADRALVRSAWIYSDFWLPGLRAVIEMDSTLHDHVRDVRRDVWLRRHRIQTIRFVGSDFFAAPDDALRDFLRGLVSLGWRPSRRQGRRFGFVV